MKDNLERIAELLERSPGRWSTEADIQRHLHRLLHDDGFEREVDLGNGCRPDLFRSSDGIAIEVKIGGSPATVFRQMFRYAELSAVHGIILATNRASIGTKAPREMLGEPVEVARLWLWGIG